MTSKRFSRDLLLPPTAPSDRHCYVFCDNEGCLIPGKGLGMPLDKLATLSGVLKEHPWIGFSICTGRSIPYVEAMTQILDLTNSNLPFICEGGAALYWPGRDSRGDSMQSPYEALADFPVEDFLRDTRSYLEGSAYRVELGKMACLSFYPNHPWTVPDLFDRICSHHPNREQFSILQSSAAVDVTLRGLDKAFGLRVACERIKVPLAHVVCIGDSGNDVPMLAAAGAAACPSNATPAVKAMCDYVAAGASTDGVIEILRAIATLSDAT